MKNQTRRGALLLGLALSISLCVQAAPVTFSHYNNASLFIDISGTGTALSLSDDGEANITTTVGNAIFGAGTVRVGNNGGIGFTSLGDLGITNAALPSANVFGGATALLPFWDDIDSDTGDVYWQESGGTLIVQWDNRPHFSNTGSATFQLQLFSAGPVLARFVYGDVDFGNSSYDFGQSATIGYQASIVEAYQYSFNSPVLANGDVIDIYAGQSAIPEPSTMWFAAPGLLALMALRRRSRKGAASLQE